MAVTNQVVETQFGSYTYTYIIAILQICSTTPVAFGSEA